MIYLAVLVVGVFVAFVGAMLIVIKATNAEINATEESLLGMKRHATPSKNK